MISQLPILQPQSGLLYFWTYKSKRTHHSVNGLGHGVLPHQQKSNTDKGMVIKIQKQL